jgi:hypothetical protein
MDSNIKWRGYLHYYTGCDDDILSDTGIYKHTKLLNDISKIKIIKTCLT